MSGQRSGLRAGALQCHPRGRSMPMLPVPEAAGGTFPKVPTSTASIPEHTRTPGSVSTCCLCDRDGAPDSCLALGWNR